MKVRFLKIVVLLLAVSLTGTAWSAGEDYHWTGEGDDNLWTTPENWDPLGPPLSDSGNIWISAPNAVIVEIPSGYTARCTFGGGGDGTIFGPDWGPQLDIYGGLEYDWYIAPMQNDSTNPSTINMYDGSTMSGEGVALGYSWWISTAPYAELNMYGDAYVDINWMWWGGEISLVDGGTLDISGGIVADDAGNVSDDTRRLEIENGTLLLPADFNDVVKDWVARGIVSPYGGMGELVIEQVDVDSVQRTQVTAIPEPATMLILGLGSLVVIRRTNVKGFK